MIIVILTIVLCLLALTIHELGHYEAMRRCGIPVSEVSLLGFPIPGLPSIRINRNGTTWSIHPLILGAYVRATDNTSMAALSLPKQLYIYGNGVVANVVYSFILLGVDVLLIAVTCTASEKIPSCIVGSILILLACIIWMSRRFIAYAMPLLSILATWFVVTVFFSTDHKQSGATDTTTPKAATESVETHSGKPTVSVEIKPAHENQGGTLAIAAVIGSVQTVQKALTLAASVSLSLALMNILLLVPLDGGWIINVTLQKIFKLPETFLSVYQVVGVFMVLGLIVYAVWSDIMQIGAWLFH